MKSKIFSLMVLSALALVFLIGFTSAAVDFIPNAFTPTIEQGNSAILSFKISENGYEDLTGITFNTPITFTSGIYSFDSATSVSGAITTLTQNTTSSDMAITINVPIQQQPGVYTGILSLTDLTYSHDIDDLPITLTVTEKSRPTEITECLGIGDSGNLMDLEIEDISIVSGFGEEDNEWVPLDTIEVEIRVENNDRDFDLEDIEISWGLYNTDTQEWIIDDEESDFDLKDGEEETILIEFKLDDPEEFENSDDYVFYVWANAIGEELDNPVCQSVYENIDVIIEKDFLILDDFEIEGISVEDEFYYDLLSCEGTYQLTADIWNIGDSDQEDIEVRIYNADFGIDEVLDIGDIDAFDYESISFEFSIPKGSEEEIWHALEFTIKEDGDIFENDYVEEDAEFQVLFKLENCAFPQAFVGAALDSEAKAGREMVVRTTITNTGAETTNYLVNAFGYSEWASSINIEPRTITLEPGQSRDVLITLDVDRDVSGERLFNIEVLSEGELVMAQPLSVNIEKALLGDIFQDNTLITALIIGIAVILIVIIIILAVRLARK